MNMRSRFPEASKKPSLRDLKKFDVYTKVEEDYRIKTCSGGMVSLFSMTTMLLLFLTEFHGYLTVDVVDHIIVDTTLDQKLPIGVNITFPHLPCDEVYVDTVDKSMEAHADVHGAMHKTSINADWSIAREPAAGECLSCWGLELEVGDLDEKRCCNTCPDLKKAYKDAGMSYFDIAKTAPQCKDAIGCRIQGEVLVSKIAGNFHVAQGKSVAIDGHLMHDTDFEVIRHGFNTSHYIHLLRFGEQVHDMTSTLEGTAKISTHGSYMFHYYIKLVPTLYTASDGSMVYTHQYSVTEKDKNVLSSQTHEAEVSGLPGVYFVYVFTPFMVQKIEKPQPLSHFLVSICAIIGGVFTVASMIDSALYKSYKHLKKVSPQ
jgi:hypothetical protein